MLRGRGNTRQQHRLPAAPLDLRPARPAASARRTSPSDPCLNLRQLPAARAGTACCSRTTAATSPPTWPRIGPARRPRLQRLRARPRAAARVRLQLEDLHRGLPGGLPRRPVPPRAWAASSPATTCAGSSAAQYSVQTVGVHNALAQGRLARSTSAGTSGAALPRRRAARARRDLADLLPARHGRVVPARAGGLDAVPARARSKTLNMVEFFYPEEIAAFEREFVEAAAGRLHGDLRRGRRDRAAHGRRPQGAAGARRRRGRPLPEPDGRRHAALPRVVPARDGRRAG